MSVKRMLGLALWLALVAERDASAMLHHNQTDVASLQDDLSQALNEICFSVGELDIEALALQLGWTEEPPTNSAETGSDGSPSDRLAWVSPYGVSVYNMAGNTEVCSIEVLGDNAFVAAEIIAALMDGRPESYIRRTSPYPGGRDGYISHYFLPSEGQNYLFDVPGNSATPVGIIFVGETRLGPTMVMTIPTRHGVD